jgi:hypothetical protein
MFESLTGFVASVISISMQKVRILMSYTHSSPWFLTLDDDDSK